MTLPVAVLCIVPMRCAVSLGDVARHAHPAVVHAQRREHLIAHVGLEASAVEPVHDLGQDRHPAGEVVARSLPGQPVGLGLDRADPGDDLVPVGGARRGARDRVAAADAGGVREEVAQRDAVLAVGAELGRCFTTGSSSSSAPRSHCCAIETATLGFVIENQMTIESGVIGMPARASPTARSASGAPSTET